MPKTDTVAGIGTAGAIAKVLSAEAVEALAIDTADAKARLNEAKEAFANAEAAWLETGNDEYRTSDGRKLTVVRGATRNIDPVVLKELVGRGVWARITERAVVTRCSTPRLLAVGLTRARLRKRSPTRTVSLRSEWLADPRGASAPRSTWGSP